MIVMKFGGTSVKDSEAYNRVIEIVKSRISRNPVVVLSATAGTTDLLLESCEEAKNGSIKPAKRIIEKIRDRHLELSNALIKDPGLKKKLDETIEDYSKQISDYIRGIFLLSELSQRSIAKVVSFGELFSTAILSFALKENGIDNELTDSRDFIISDENYTKGEPVIDEIRMKANKILNPLIEKNIVPVVQGFIGKTLKGEASTLGRGGSDYTASIIGSVLDAEEIEIWTDVDGILTADPRKIQNVKIVNEISFKEAAELAFFGAKVLHPSTIIPAIEKNIPVRILNSQKPDSPGTLVLAEVKDVKNIKAITSKEKIKVVNIYSPKMLFAHGFLKKIFEVFDKYKTSVDLITTSEVNVSLTLDNDENLDLIVKELSEFSEVDTDDTKSLVCIVGSNIKYTKGIAKKIFHVVEDFNINMISQGASVINFSFVVDREYLTTIIQKLHDEFFGK